MSNGQSSMPRQSAWLSRGLEALIDRDHSRFQNDPASHFDFDVVIVGSGYGGAIAAAALSGVTDTQSNNNSLRICILERGKEYLTGSFPSSAADLAGLVRFATPNARRQRGVFDGLYDVRWSDDAVSLVACGLGGGSLINAGVMEMPLQQVFQEARWPEKIRNNAQQIIEEGKKLRKGQLGAGPIAHTFDGSRRLAKSAALESLAKTNGGTFGYAEITVSDQDNPNSAGVRLNKCLRCGDCATGCNHNAKNSLDVTLLHVAKENGAEIFTGATVLRVSPAKVGDMRGWQLFVNHTDSHLRDRQPQPFILRSKYVVLAAGTFGSTEILKRSKSEELQLSPQLGHKFSANGDMIVTVYDTKDRIKAVADETNEPDPNTPGGGRDIGPTITSVMDLREGDSQKDVVIEDLAVPGALRRLFEEATTTYDVLNTLAEPNRLQGGSAGPDDAAVNRGAIDKSLVLAMIGRDDAEGEIKFGRDPICDDADGLLTVSWPELKNDPRFAKHHERLRDKLCNWGLGGRIVSNLMWRPFSNKLENIFGPQRGPLLTVHPLGGCAMGEDASQGVTDYCGRVFDASGSSHKGSTSTHHGLVVLDGSIVPTSLGINPALTIATIAQRAISELIQEWGLKPVVRPPRERAVHRPIFAMPVIKPQPKPTRIELTEQMRGSVFLRTGHRETPRPHEVEITLTTEPVEIDKLIAYEPAGGRCLQISPAKKGKPAGGRLRILKPNTTFDPISDEPFDNDVELEAEISGELKLFALEYSSSFQRNLAAAGDWLCNRGVRDLVYEKVIRAILERLRLRPPQERRRTNWRDYFLNMRNVLSRASAVRLIEYNLKIEKLIESATPSGAQSLRRWFEENPGASISGIKRITYAYACSPWTQALKLSLTAFPGMTKGDATFELNKRYLAYKAVPLIRVVEQENRVSALMDQMSFWLYVLRVVLQVQALTFRKPDAPTKRIPQRLPGAVPHLPIPQIDWLTVASNKDEPVLIRMTRYDASLQGKSQLNAPRRPVLLIHGYSASGTTFVHSAVPGNLVEMLCKQGRDVWVLDMRSSAGLPTATEPWAFEDMAEKDIPVAIDHIRTKTGSQKVDIVGQCMGCAMLSMALLSENKDLSNLHEKIGRAVFSQVGPILILSRSNILAAYIMRYIRQFLNLEEYKFSPEEGSTLVIDEFLDRALSAMAVPLEEFKRENPLIPPGKATPWVGTRHRMDALYARTFTLNNISDDVLDKIDDFFGPLSVETVSQVIHFAMCHTITNRKGFNSYVGYNRLKERFTFPLMSIHGEDNGLVDKATLTLMRDALRNSGVAYLNKRKDGFDPTCLPQTETEIIELITRESAAGQLRSNTASYLTWLVENQGHQDCLIGRNAKTICGVVATYLCTPDPAENTAVATAHLQAGSR